MIESLTFPKIYQLGGWLKVLEMGFKQSVGKLGENFHGVSGRIQEEPGNSIDLSEKNDIDFSEKLGFQKSRIFNGGALFARRCCLEQW